MADLQHVMRLIDKKNVPDLLKLIVEQDQFGANQAIAFYLWNSFLPNYEPDSKAQVSNKSLEQIENDMVRAVHHFVDIPEDQVERYRKILKRCIVAVLEQHDHLHYYQSFHDVATVLVVKFGFKRALILLNRLCHSHLKLFMTESMDPSVDFANFVFALLERVDRKLAARLHELKMPPFFFISWCLSWLSHDMRQFKDASQIFDALVMLPPAGIGYLSAVILKGASDRVIAWPKEDFGELHQFLKELPETTWKPAYINEAYALMQRIPPSKVIRSSVPSLRESIFDSDLPRSDVLTAPIIFTFLVLVLAFLYQHYIRNTPLMHLR